MSESLTQFEAARRGVITREMRRVAERERVTAEFVADEVARGRLVIPANMRHLAGSGGEPPNGRASRPVRNGHAGACRRHAIG